MPGADVGVIDVAIDDVTHRIATGFASQGIGGGADCIDFGAASREQLQDVRRRQLLACEWTSQHRIERGDAPVAREQLHPRRRLGGYAGHPLVVAREAARVGCDQNRSAHRGIRPGVELLNIVRIDGKSLGQHFARGPRLSRESLDRRPWLLGIDVVDGDGRNAAPIVDACVDQFDEPALGKVRRCLDAHPRTENDARNRDRPAQFVDRCRGRTLHARAGLRREALDYQFLDVAMVPGKVADPNQAGESIRPGFADADEQARGRRHALMSGVIQALHPHGRRLVRRTVMGPATLQ